MCKYNLLFKSPFYFFKKQGYNPKRIMENDVLKP